MSEWGRWMGWVLMGCAVDASRLGRGWLVLMGDEKMALVFLLIFGVIVGVFGCVGSRWSAINASGRGV
jgi:hypothetical protein